jgi:SAM-dependent methyltransferase
MIDTSRGPGAAGEGSCIMSLHPLRAVVFCLTLVLLLPAGVARAEDPPFEIEDWEVGLNKRQPPVRIMDAIELRAGMVVGEIGAGSGRMTLWLAHRVGKTGRIYANDIDEKALDKLERRCGKEEIDNVTIILGQSENPLLPKNTLDLLFMINVYHHADDPVALLRSAKASLKPGGRLAIVECDPDKTDWGEEHGCTGVKKMNRQLGRAGYEVVHIESFLDEDSIYLARPLESER